MMHATNRLITPDGRPIVFSSINDEESHDDDPLWHWQVHWEDLSDDDIRLLEETLNQATSERPIQLLLQMYPWPLIQHLQGGHGRWVIFQLRLGSQYIPDFVLGERDSLGYHWTLVELQSPIARPFTRKGRLSEHLDEGIRQISDWRRWLASNREYAQRHPAQHGLGLPEIDHKSAGLILLGRAAERSARDRERLRQLSYELRIAIHSYDWVVKTAQDQWEVLLAWDKRK